MNYKHLTIEERACISKFKEMNLSIREMAKLLDRSPSTISRELKRNSYKTGKDYSIKRYMPTDAHRKYKNRRVNSHRKTNIDCKVKEYIEDKLNKNWSPEQIINYKDIKPINFPSVCTIYRWIHLELLKKITMQNLRRKGKFKRPTEKRGKFNIGKIIKKRHKEVYNRNTFGH